MSEGALILHVNVRPDPSGVLYANSPDLVGLHVCGQTIEQVQERVVKAIKAIFRHSQRQNVEVFPVAESLESFAPKHDADKFIVHRKAA
jgi:hypothetical protein